MLRVGTTVLKVWPHLMRRGNTVEIRVATISDLKKTKDTVRERESCPIPPPPKIPPPKDDSLFWGTLAFFIVAGVASAYAKDKKEIRDWLSIQAPWADEIIAVIFEENCTILESIGYKFDELKAAFAEWNKELPPECLDGEAVIKPVPLAPIFYEVPETNDDTCGDDDDDDDDDDGDDGDDDHFNIQSNYSQDPGELEACIKDNALTGINNYITVRDACKYYNDLVPDTMNNFTQKKFNDLDDAQTERNELVKKHNCLAKEATKVLDDLLRFVQCAYKAPPDQVAKAKQMIRDAKKDIDKLRCESIKEGDMSEQMDNLKAKMKVVIDAFSLEIRSMYPKVNYLDERPTTACSDLDFLLIQSMKNMDSLKAKVEIMQRDQRSKVVRTVEKLDVDQSKVSAAEPKAKQDLEKFFSDKMQQAHKDLEDYRKKKLDDMKTDFEERTAAQIKKMEDEALITIADGLANRPPIPKHEMKKLQLQIVELEAKLEARLKYEKESVRAQTLYEGAMLLMKALKKGDRYVDVNKELALLEKYSEGDNLVETVLKAIPAEVKDKGLAPESVLKRNYRTMEDIAMKVAMLESEGAPLPVYCISWLQYKMLMKPLLQPKTIPQAELDKPPKELGQFDTFDLLQRASYYVERGRMSAALRYVGALLGASRGAADVWYRDATGHAQALQAAEAIMAHASALNIESI